MANPDTQPVTQDEQELLDELTDMFYDVVPDEKYLKEDEDTADDVNRIKGLIHNKNETVASKISALLAFNSKWFPDGLSESEQTPYKKLIKEVESLLMQILMQMK